MPKPNKAQPGHSVTLFFESAAQAVDFAAQAALHMADSKDASPLDLIYYVLIAKAIRLNGPDYNGVAAASPAAARRVS